MIRLHRATKILIVVMVNVLIVVVVMVRVVVEGGKQTSREGFPCHSVGGGERGGGGGLPKVVHR